MILKAFWQHKIDIKRLFKGRNVSNWGYDIGGVAHKARVEKKFASKSVSCDFPPTIYVLFYIACTRPLINRGISQIFCFERTEEHFLTEQGLILFGDVR